MGSAVHDLSNRLEESDQPLERAHSSTTLSAAASAFVPQSGILGPAASIPLLPQPPAPCEQIFARKPQPPAEAPSSLSQKEPHPSQPAPVKQKESNAEIHPAKLQAIKSKILAQVEFYFSDQNMPTDMHLLKLAKNDKEGFVPLAHVGSFRKVKALMPKQLSGAACALLLASALRDSSLLVVSEDGKKVARRDPLPDVDMTDVLARTVVADNLPADVSIGAMEELFGTVGTVRLVRVCQPDSKNGTSALRALYPKANVLTSPKVHAIVEYESTEAAGLAVKKLNDERDWRSGLRVRFLTKRPPQGQAKREYSQSPLQNARATPAMEHGAGEGGGRPESHGMDTGTQEGKSAAAATTSCNTGDAAVVGSAPEGEGSMKRGRGSRGRGRGRGRGGATAASGLSVGSTTKSTPSKGTLGSSPTSMQLETTKPLPGPRMPDGTKGFTFGRGKALHPPS